MRAGRHTDFYLQPAVSPISIFCSGVWWRKGEISISALASGTGIATVPRLAGSLHSSQKNGANLSLAPPPLYPFQMRDLKNNKYKARVGGNACAPLWSFPSPGRQRCPDELGAVPGEHCWGARSKVSLEKGFFLLNLDAKMLLGGGGGDQRQGCQT